MKALYTGFFLLFILCLAAQKEATFTVKKPTPKVEDKVFPIDTFYFGQYDIATLTNVPDFLSDVDSIYAGDTVSRAFSQSTINYGSIETTNLSAVERRGILTITAPNKVGVGEIRLLRRDTNGVNRIFYRHSIKIVARPVVSD